MTLQGTREGWTRQEGVEAQAEPWGSSRGGLSGSELGVDEQVVSVIQESCPGDVRLNLLQSDKLPDDPKTG